MDWLPLFLFGFFIVGAMFVISRYQQRSYREYLSKHTAETAKVTENQAALIKITERQAEAVSRIATALEKRNGE